LVDALPADVRFLSATTSAGGCADAGATVTCTLGTLNSGDSGTVVIVVKPGRVGVISNTARVRGAQPDPDGTSNA
jgi:Domain of unknown function DUF11